MLLKFPYPPTVNNYLKPVISKGRVIFLKSAAFRDFQNKVTTAIKLSKVKGFGETPVAIKIFSCLPDRRKRDIDNILKPLFDSFTYTGLIADDSFIKQVEVIKLSPDDLSNVTDKNALFVEIKEYQSVTFDSSNIGTYINLTSH